MDSSTDKEKNEMTDIDQTIAANPHWTPEAIESYRASMTTTESVLRSSDLPTDLVDHMLANVKRTSEPCPVCHVGRGRMCAHR